MSAALSGGDLNGIQPTCAQFGSPRNSPKGTVTATNAPIHRNHASRRRAGLSSRHSTPDGTRIASANQSDESSTLDLRVFLVRSVMFV
jgi:hypothetical protein